MAWHAWEEESIEILPDVTRTNTEHQRRVRIKQPFSSRMLSLIFSLHLS
jgi:hypothetical protein